jgi:hypothetical protein
MVVLSFAGVKVARFAMLPEPVAIAAYFALLLTTATAAALLSWNVLEKHFLNLKRLF